jgi:hypothetical protein
MVRRAANLTFAGQLWMEFATSLHQYVQLLTIYQWVTFSISTIPTIGSMLA